MTVAAIVTGAFVAGAATINGFADCVGIALWRVKQGVFASLNGIDEVVDHRVTGMFLWVCYFAVQDLLKDSDVQTIIASPASISMMEWSSWVFIAFKVSLPVFGGIITYKSDSWARKGRQASGITEPKVPVSDNPPAATTNIPPPPPPPVPPPAPPAPPGAP